MATTPRGRLRWWPVALLATSLAALVAGLVVLSVHRQDRVVLPPPTPSTAAATELVCPNVPPSRRATLTLPRRPRVLIFGDSYTQGYGADPQTRGYAYQVGAPLGWRVTADGVGGTGYLNPGPKNVGTYQARLRAAPRATYDLVVVEGGSNDSRMPIEQLEPAVETTIRLVHHKYPGAQIAVMGPLEVHGTATQPRADVNTVLTRYTASNRLPFFSPLCERWFRPGDTKTLVNRANGHPNNAGYARVAAMFVRDMKRLQSPAASTVQAPTAAKASATR